MSEATKEFFVGHPWCSNIPRDEAVRAAEDAAAASQAPLPDHRELPESFDHLRSILHDHLGDFSEALKIVRRMNKKLESLEEHCKIEAAKVARLWILHEGVLPGDHLSASPSCASRIEVLCNTCRGIVGLEPTCPDCNGAGKVWKRSSTSEPWKYADEDPPCFRVGFDKDDYERKAAATRAAAAASGSVEKKPMQMPSRAWFERMASVDDSEMSVGGLASRVAELDSAAKLAPAATADAGSNHAPAASGAAGTEVVAWGVIEYQGGPIIHATPNEDEATQYAGDTVPLYAAPQAAKGWLTAEEREAVTTMAAVMERDAAYFEKCQEPGHAKAGWRRAKVFRDLLARSSPPEVVMPTVFQRSNLGDPLVALEQVKAALAAAGVTCKEVGK